MGVKEVSQVCGIILKLATILKISHIFSNFLNLNRIYPHTVCALVNI